LLLLPAIAVPALQAVQRDAYKDVRERYEGLSLRLRVDLHAAGRAVDPNVVTLDGVGYPSERSPVLFYGLETVFVQRIVNEAGTRLGLTVYRNQDEANRLRASAIPAPSIANPNFNGTIAAYAMQGSTSVVLDLKADKKDRLAQLTEIETLLDRVFYM